MFGIFYSKLAMTNIMNIYLNSPTIIESIKLLLMTIYEVAYYLVPKNYFRLIISALRVMRLYIVK